MQKTYLNEIFQNALSKIGITEQIDLHFEIPKNQDHGDVASNIAMKLARELKKKPMDIAMDIIANLNYDSSIISSISIAGAGFINVKFTEKFYSEVLRHILDLGSDYGKSNVPKHKKVNVEYVSANPTGLLHLGHGRNAALGDTIANLYVWNGYEVTREYYFNNAGNQMNNLAKSIYARYMEILGSQDFPFPEDGYHGEYVRTIAQEIADKWGSDYKEGTYQDITELKKYGENWCFNKIRETLDRMKISQDVFFNEDSLYKDGKINEVIEEFRAKNLAYDKDGAIWLKLSEMGLESDRVIVKSSGEPTYRLPDIAYHREKFRRGFDIVVDLFGADHIATIPDVLAGVKALGFDTESVKVIIHQFVTLTENGEQVKMSKRTGKSYTLDELVDEVGEDVVRFFLIMRSFNTHLEFDLALAKEQSEKNPVFYLQYAFARISSLFDNAQDKGIQVDAEVDLSALNKIQEINLIKELIAFPEIVELACYKHEPHLLCDYLKNVASAFHNFYHHCRIIGEEEKVMQARFKLAAATKTVIHNGLKILGITAPERM